ncbi:Exodeoxyribonuclease 7 large subunit [Pseudodesulfovibrio profundus]|uniref:Exodeoxyribonuclease 7 large subunit n=1 Tax=Pseudodesulfovibrio profundus TaxID=57320 RepID=A0A2C8FB82_9BACT|nr:exodeoxyribonuclease VII large subunit [Pseudodesulfovibrio profundus]SOB59709.1 Exodeoxyribonuclease 7 large subunit [Pseudodesulfovibrio profundus]
MSAIFTVSELTRSVKNLLEAEFPFVWVRGEISNLSRPASGHIYFTLTDGNASLSVVWFKSAQTSGETISHGEERINPLTGEVEEQSGATGLTGTTIEDGMEVLCAGRLNVYEPRGQYQLVAELVQDQGVGDLAIAFEALKRKLAEKGYFDEDRKLTLPENPKRVAVVTSSSGAAIRDFLRLADTRGTGAQIRIYPSLVQGDQAPKRIAKALDQADEDGWAEVIVLIRGGGSLEDLWAFNTEPVADAIYRARLPVISGIGHEPDVTIADFVADKRAATPSHAAQELWPRREQLAQKIDDLEMRLTRRYAEWLLGKGAAFEQLRKALIWLSPERKLERMQDRFGHLIGRLEAAGQTQVDRKLREMTGTVQRLHRAHGPRVVRQTASRTASLVERLTQAMNRHQDIKERNFELMQTTLAGLDPQAPLDRGYSLVRIDRTGDFLRDPKEVTAGDTLAITVRDGSVSAVVTEDSNDSREQ